MDSRECEEAKWHAAGFNSDHYALTRKHGWTRRQYQALLILESTERITTCANLDVPFHVALEAWITSGIPAERALLYREARLTVGAALSLEDRRCHGEPIDEAMQTLLALRRTPRERHWHRDR